MSINETYFIDDEETVEYRDLINDIVADANHLLRAAVDKTISNYYYSIELDSDDDAITVMFEKPINNQNETVELIGHEIRSGISMDFDVEGLTVFFLKNAGYHDEIAELSRFTFV